MSGRSGTATAPSARRCSCCSTRGDLVKWVKRRTVDTADIRIGNREEYTIRVERLYFLYSFPQRLFAPSIPADHRCGARDARQQPLALRPRARATSHALCDDGPDDPGAGKGHGRAAHLRRPDHHGRGALADPAAEARRAGRRRPSRAQLNEPAAGALARSGGALPRPAVAHGTRVPDRRSRLGVEQTARTATVNLPMSCRRSRYRLDALPEWA